MKKFHVNDPAFHLDIPFASKFAASAALEHSNGELFSSSVKQEELLPFHEFMEFKFQGLPSSKSMGCAGDFSSFAEEKSSRGVDCFGLPLCNSAEISNWAVHNLGNMIMPEEEMDKNIDESVCRGRGRMEGDSFQEAHVAALQASMEAMKGNGGYRYCMGMERDYLSNFQASVSPIKRPDSSRLKESMASDQGNYVHDPLASMFALASMSPPAHNSFSRFLPSNHEEHNADFFSSDEFRMFEFKVRRCMRGRSHDWTECPFSHPGEKARRRDPRRFHYSGTVCPDFRRGTCRRGDSCELSHGVFECWLHPARYRTQLCKDGKSCKRRVCFFAHSSSQLRYVSPDNGFALKSPLASPTDAMTSYSERPYKHLPFFAGHSSSVRHGLHDGYGGGDVHFDEFSSVNTHGFPQEGIHDGFCQLAVNCKRGPNDRNFEHFDGKPSHGHGLSVDGLPNHLKFDCNRDRSHCYALSSDGHLVDESGYEGSHGHYSSGGPPSDCSSFKASQSHVNLRNHLALASLKSNIDQIMSPTSTLIGHVSSPPPLSPPLSPSESPPVSPAEAWGTLSRRIASLSGQPLSQAVAPGMDANPMIANGISLPVTQFQASLLANLAHNNGVPPFANARGPSPLSINSLGDNKHEIDRPSSMPTSHEPIEDGISLQNMAPMKAYPAHAMAHLISTLQHMELGHAAVDMKNARRPYLPHRNPNLPKSGESWDVDSGAAHQRVESGQGLRAKIYGKLGREAGFEIENPDLNWVNELVK